MKFLQEFKNLLRQLNPMEHKHECWNDNVLQSQMKYKPCLCENGNVYSSCERCHKNSIEASKRELRNFVNEKIALWDRLYEQDKNKRWYDTGSKDYVPYGYLRDDHLKNIFNWIKEQGISPPFYLQEEYYKRFPCEKYTTEQAARNKSSRDYDKKMNNASYHSGYGDGGGDWSDFDSDFGIQ